MLQLIVTELQKIKNSSFYYNLLSLIKSDIEHARHDIDLEGINLAIANLEFAKFNLDMLIEQMKKDQKKLKYRNK